jgi:hypothetical protein
MPAKRRSNQTTHLVTGKAPKEHQRPRVKRPPEIDPDALADALAKLEDQAEAERARRARRGLDR